jgi:uncharacterized protein YqgC (DUF456 family)
MYYLIAAALVVIGLIGTVLPALPGLPLVFAGMLLAAWAGGFEQIGVATVVVLGLLTLASLAIDFWATALGAKRVRLTPKLSRPKRSPSGRFTLPAMRDANGSG